MTPAVATPPLRSDSIRATPLGQPLDLLAALSDPRLRESALLSVRGWRLLVGEPRHTLTTLAQLNTYATAIGWRDPPPDGPPFRGGAIGVLSDDLSAGFVRLPADHRPPLPHVPALRFTTHAWALAVGPDGEGWIVGNRQDTLRLGALVNELNGKPPLRPPPPPRIAHAGLDRAQHARAVAQILQWIAAGDLYQANLTFQVTTPWPGSAQELARRLEGATPDAAHAAIVPLGPGSTAVSVSPETFLRTSANEVTSRPIKGTRPRHTDPEQDLRNGAELTGSAKDGAEHVMIVDLVRNDLGRVCQPGSVRVPDLARLEQHPTVWHLASTVSGQLRDDVDLADLLVATFPPGSVTGAPKRRAVERIRAVEPARRGVYCGAIGLIAPGAVDLSVAIRSAVVANGVASYGTGGGIVADSRAEDEYAEALAKAAAFLSATNATLP